MDSIHTGAQQTNTRSVCCASLYYVRNTRHPHPRSLNPHEIESLKKYNIPYSNGIYFRTNITH
ncbi:hypothetical protein HMPREF9441_02808 [Paraprevotella clara YIT 11840]|uniref:Uncharacterized protein n=1 Tax=Paraprevotella clara YIT 11840 TaxID=762968 RepID=G5STV3_9BACT|nr:hypothetical protein HMPREF9441_02808 [Paraprevotella clara YIT 11840]